MAKGVIMILKDHVIGEGRPLVCVPVVEKTDKEIEEAFHFLSDCPIDVIEWRVDYYEGLSSSERLLSLLQRVASVRKDKLLLITIRSKAEGGFSDLSEAEIDKILLEIASSELCDLMDVEFYQHENARELINYLHDEGVCIVASHHDFDKTPDNETMMETLLEMTAGDADIVKLAVMPKNAEDVLRLLTVTTRFHERHKSTPAITMSMGSVGAISRITGEAFGSCLTFASYDKTSAPGQLPVDTAKAQLEFVHRLLEG